MPPTNAGTLRLFRPSVVLGRFRGSLADRFHSAPSAHDVVSVRGRHLSGPRYAAAQVGVHPQQDARGKTAEVR